MTTASAAPATLQEAMQHFADPDASLDFVVGLRWPDGVTCPHCEAKEPSYLKTRRIWKCRSCRKQFSVKVGTIFEDSPIGLDKWLPALWMLANCKNGISSYELARDLGVTQKTAWFMLHRIRLAMQTRTFQKMRGKIEADETFLGGKAKFMHKSVKRRRITSTGGKDKVAVMGLLQRKTKKGHSTVMASVLAGTTRHDLQPQVRSNVAKGSDLFTDAHTGYIGLRDDYRHAFIDHAVEYVRGEVHTNCLENFWSCLKRTIKGTYVAVDPFHVFRYLDEQTFRFNNRQTDDHGRFRDVVRQIIGKRLTYADLIGAHLLPTTT